MFRSRQYTFYKRRSTLSVVLGGLFRTIILVFLLFQLVQVFLVQSYRVGSSSMRPGLEIGDRVFAVPLLYGPRIPVFNFMLPGLRSPARGDVVIITPPYHRPEIAPVRAINPVVRFLTGGSVSIRRRLSPGWDGEQILKRIVGLPGDTIRFEDHLAYIRPEGAIRFDTEFTVSSGRYDVLIEAVPEGWLSSDPLSGTASEITLGPYEYFVVGDNRSVSVDSRSWGQVSREVIRARVMVRYWPPRRLGVF